jgi:hypothetical protein
LAKVRVISARSGVSLGMFPRTPAEGLAIIFCLHRCKIPDQLTTPAGM